MNDLWVMQSVAQHPSSTSEKRSFRGLTLPETMEVNGMTAGKTIFLYKQGIVLFVGGVFLAVILHIQNSFQKGHAWHGRSRRDRL